MKKKKKIMKKRTCWKNSWYDLVPSYIPEPITETVGATKNKIMSSFKTNTAMDYYHKQNHVKIMHVNRKKPRKVKMQKQSKDRIIKNIRNLIRQWSDQR